jgi:hypothetical protein
LFVRILPCLVSTMNMLACFFISESFVIWSHTSVLANLVLT